MAEPSDAVPVSHSSNPDDGDRLDNTAY